MTKDLFDRYIWLVDTIYRTGKITFEEINESWLRSKLSGGVDIPLRSFHNWRTAIEQIFNINIECNRKGGYYYYIQNVDDLEKDGFRNWLLNTFTVNNLINESHSLKDRILFEEIPSGRQYLTPVIEAMHEGLEIKLYHQSYWYDEPRIYTVQPYCVKVFRQRWYIIGFCKERNAIRIFSLDRIHSLTVLESHFIYPKEFDPAGYFINNFGIIVGEGKVERIRIKVYGLHYYYIRALPLHPSQKEIEATEEYVIFEYLMEPTFDFKQELLSRGAEVEVLSPKFFRNEMFEAVNEMLDRYKYNYL